MAKKITPEVESFAKIKVVGCGGGGGNAINHMVDSQVRGVDFIAVNTDAQDLHHSSARLKVHIGKNLTRGLGTGMSPDLGKRAAEETREELQEVLKGADMVFITAGMGGGTGTGSSPIVAKIAREMGALTVGVVTKPFFFEGSRRMQVALHGIQNLQNEVDALIVIPNDRLLQAVGKDTAATDAFKMADQVLLEAVEGISDLITMPGIINVDFADIRSVMENAGSALMGVGRASGENRATEAAQAAINSPLLDVSINGAKGVLFAIAGAGDLTMYEIQESAKVITESIDRDAKVIFGAIHDDRLKKSEVKVTVVATGFPEEHTRGLDPLSALLSFGAPRQNNESQKEESNRIFNTVKETFPQVTRSQDPEEDSDSTSVPSTTSHTEEIPSQKTSQPEPQTTSTTVEEDWGPVPGFLRRNRSK